MDLQSSFLLPLLVGEIVSLYIFSRLLTQSLSMIFYRLTRSREKTIYLLAGIFFPGTLIHELSHVLVAGVLLVSVGEFTAIPKIEEDGVKLGSAEVGKTDPFRRALIGIAPVLMGSSLIIVSVWFLAFKDLSLTIITLYLVFVVANTMFSSPKDLEGTVEVLAVIVGIVSALYFLGYLDFNWILESILTPQVQQIIKKSLIYLSIPIGIDIIVYLLNRIILKKITYNI